MIFRALPFMIVVFFSCSTTSKMAQMKIIAEENKDVVVLAYLIRDYMRKTDNTNFTLADILKNDTLGRITTNFTKLKVGNWPNPWRGGYAVYFKFADRRMKDSIALNEQEIIPWKVKTKEKIGGDDAQLIDNFDGEIHFYYPERFYHITEIIIKKPAD